MDKVDIIMWIMIAVISFAMGLNTGIQTMESKSRANAIKAGVGEYVITDPVKGITDFQYKTNFIEVSKSPSLWWNI